MALTVYLTNAGRLLQARAQTGTTLNFSRLQIGSGVLTGLPTERTSLITPVAYVAITRLRVNSDSTVTVGGKWDNGDITEGFYFREVGLWADDPDDSTAEILYAYAYDSDGAQSIPAGGGDAVIEKTINIITAIGNATEVTATISSAGAVNPEDLEDYVPITRKVNNKPLVADVTLTASDVGAAAAPTEYTATLTAAGWSSTAPYTQTVTVSGVLSTDRPIVDVVQTGTAATDEAMLEAWAMVTRITTAAGSITATCLSDKPTVDIPIHMEVVR